MNGKEEIHNNKVDDKLIRAVKQKIQQVYNKYISLDKRSNPRPPKKLIWLIEEMEERKTVKIVTHHIFTSLFDIYNNHNHNIKLDSLARTFCALEDLENWVMKAEIGIKKHQKEMEKQAHHKIVRMKTFAEFGEINERINNNTDKIDYI